jgi:retinol dehydrogenase 12
VEREAPNVFEALRGAENMNQDRYNLSKLLLIMCARGLAEEMGRPGPVIVNTINPGLCRTELFRNAPFPLNVIASIGLWLLGRTPEMGSRTLMSAAFAGEETHGLHMDSCVVRDPSKYILTEDGKKMQKKVWDELKEILEGAEPGVTKNI